MFLVDCMFSRVPNPKMISISLRYVHFFIYFSAKDEFYFIKKSAAALKKKISILFQ